MTRLLATICMLLAAAPGSACGQGGAAPDEFTRLVESGRLDEAATLARRGGDSMVVALADVLVLRGAVREADSLYQVAVARTLRNARAAVAGRAELAARRRESGEARRLAGALTAQYERGATDWSAADLIAAGRAYVVLGNDDPAAYREALRVFDAVAAGNASDVEARLRAADLLLDRYNAPDARATYTEVQRIRPGHPRAFAGLARVMSFEGNGDALKLVRSAVGSSRVDLQACKLEYSIVSPK